MRIQQLCTVGDIIYFLQQSSNNILTSQKNQSLSKMFKHTLKFSNIIELQLESTIITHMHYEPRCPINKHRGHRICISANCAIQNPFVCQECASSHQEGCEIIAYKQLVKRLHTLQGIQNRQLLRYQDYVENTFTILMKSLRAEFIAFRELFEHINASDSIKQFYQYIKSRKEHKLSGHSIHKMLNQKFPLQNNYKLKSQAAMWALSGELIQLQKKINRKLPYYYSISPDAVQVDLQLEEDHPIKKVENQFRLYRQEITGGLLENTINKIESLFDRDIYNIQMLYRASKSEFSARKFHEKCDGKKNTLTIAKTEFGNVVGGFSTVSWRSPARWEYEEDSSCKTFLFSLDKHLEGRKFQPLKNKFSLGMHCDYGPCFGDDLVIYDKANTSRGCWSNFPDCYQSKTKPVNHSEQTIRQFVGVNDHFRKFCMAEWQVYLISFNRTEEQQASYLYEYRKI